MGTSDIENKKVSRTVEFSEPQSPTMPSEDDDEIQAIVRDPKTSKDTFNKKPVALFHYDCHPTKLLCNCYNTNIKVFIYAFAFNIALVFMYMDWNIFLLDFLTAMIPILFNLVFILIKDEHR